MKRMLTAGIALVLGMGSLNSTANAASTRLFPTRPHPAPAGRPWLAAARAAGAVAIPNPFGADLNVSSVAHAWRVRVTDSLGQSEHMTVIATSSRAAADAGQVRFIDSHPAHGTITVQQVRFLY